MDITEKLRSFGPDWTAKHNNGNIAPYEVCVDAANEIDRLRAALELFIETVNPPYPQSMALWQQHLKAATENARNALGVNEQSTPPVKKPGWSHGP